MKFTRNWALCFCWAMNIRIRVEGQSSLCPNALIVSNHIGSPDIFVLGSCFQTFFISKSDVAAWPLVGYLASLGATLFVDRTRRHQVKQTIAQIEERLKEGGSVIVFPEGGATDGSHILPFKASHFQGAVMAERPVLPVMIRYLDGNHPSIACWGNMGFMTHFFKLLQNPRLDAEVRILPQLPPEEDRRHLANESHRVIREAYLKYANVTFRRTG